MEPRIVFGGSLKQQVHRTFTPEERKEYERRHKELELALRPRKVAAERAEHLTAADWNLVVY